MDPLSVSASILAFLGASGTCARTLRRLIHNANHAPDEILALSNEVTDINIVLNNLQLLLESVADSQDPRQSNGFLEATNSEILKARKILILLSPIVSELFGTTDDGGIRFQRMKWVKKKSAVQALQQELVMIKRNLTLLLSSITASTTNRIYLCLNGLQIQAGQLRPPSLPEVDVTNAQTLPLGPEPGDTASFAAISDDPLSIQWQVIRQIAQFGSMTFQLSRIVRCNRVCDCQCHSRTRLQSPSSLNRLFGQLFVGYVGLPIWTRNCNRSDCINQYSRAMQISYTFPSWLLSKAVDLTTALTYNNELHFGLKLKHRVPQSENSVFNLARTGNLVGVQELYLTRQISPNDLNASTGQTALHFATEHNQGGEVAQFLLDVVKIDPFAIDDFGFSVAHHVSQAVLSNLQTSRALEQDAIFSKIAGDHSEIWDFTHIHNLVVATHHGDLDETLLDSKYRSQLNSTDAYGRTPLFWAAMRGDLTKMTSLLAAGADDSVTDCEGTPALHAAIQNGSVDCVQLLLRRGSNVHARDKHGNTALQVAAFSGDNTEILEVLYAAGASVNAQERYGTSILASAACLNHARTAEWLIGKGAHIDNTDIVGCTPLYEAVRYRNDEVAEVLLRHNARVDLKVANGRTILHALASSGTLTSVQILMKYPLLGLDADCEDHNGITAWNLFEERVGKPEGMQDALSLLLDYVRRQRLDIDEDEEEEFADALENFDSTDRLA